MFSLTDTGREFVEDYLTEEQERPDSYELRIECLEDEDVENRFDTLLDWLEEKLF